MAQPAVRLFRINVPDEALVDLRRRILATRWPDKETVPDQSQGAQLAKIQEFVRYWGTDYDWHKVEATLNALPQLLTEIDGLDSHFIHVRSPHADALPLIMTHCWPGSVLEFLKVIGPSPIHRLMVDVRRRPSTSSCPRYPATAFLRGRPRRAGGRSASREAGTS
jgi:hypothetical protein